MNNYSELNLGFENYNMASDKYEILKKEIETFQRNLSDEEDVAIQFVSTVGNTPVYVEKISYRNPDILIFYGHINGSNAEVILNISQLNFLLLSVKKEDNKEPNRIGFI